MNEHRNDGCATIHSATGGRCTRSTLARWTATWRCGYMNKCPHCGGEVPKFCAPRKPKTPEQRKKYRKNSLAKNETATRNNERKQNKRQWSKHDYADRSHSSIPRRQWSEGEKEIIFQGIVSDDELAQQYLVSTSAIRNVRRRMKNRQVVLLPEENKREIERRGGVDT